MKHYFAKRKEEIAEQVRMVCAEEGAAMKDPSPFAAELFSRLARFTARGKMIRGALVSIGAGLAAEQVPASALPLGAAMELFQSALLIHDDIMDRDELRRGELTVHTRYARDAEESGVADSLHLGEGLGICAGDVAIFLAFQLVSRAGELSGRGAELLSLCSREMVRVGTAQMSDIAWGSGWGDPSVEDVMNLYRYKTGRYTFSLPLAAGALSAGAGPEYCRRLEQFGELAGIIFQIRDDELGLFGNQEEMGKPLGSDIAEGKKTIYYLALRDAAGRDAAERLDAIFGSGRVGPREIDEVRGYAEDFGIRTMVDQRVARIRREAETVLEIIEGSEPAHEPWLGYLQELLDYVGSRNR